MSSPSISALSVCAEFLLLRSEDPLADEIFLFATNASPDKMLPQFEPFQWMREDEKKECLESAKMVLKVLRYLQIKVLENGETFESAKKKIDSSPLSTAQKNVVYKLYNEKVQKNKNKGRKANRSNTPQKTTRAASNEKKQPAKTEWVSKDKNWTDDASKEYKSTHKEEKKSTEKKAPPPPKKENTNNTNWGEIWNQQKNEKAARGRQNNNRKNTPEKAQHQQKRNRSDTPQQRQFNSKKQQISIASVLPQSQQTETTLKSALAGSANRSRSEPASKRQVRFQDEQNAGLLGALAWNTEQSNSLIGAIAWNKEQNRGLVNALAWNNHQNRALVNALAWNQEAKKWGPDATPPAELKPSFKPSQPQPQQFEAPKAPQQFEAPKAPEVQQFVAPPAPKEPVAPAREVKPEPRSVSYEAPREFKPRLFSEPKPAGDIIYKNAWKPPRAAQQPRSPTGSPVRRPNYQAQITKQLIQKLDEAEQIEWNKRAPFAWKQYETEKKVEPVPQQFEEYTYEFPASPPSPSREYYNENGYYESEAPVKYALNRHIMLGARAASVPPTEKDQERIITPKLQPRESPKESEASRGRLAASKYFETNNNHPKDSRWSSTGSTGSSMGRFSSTDNSSQGRSPSIGFTIETPEERAVKENTKKNERPGTIPEEPEVQNFDVVDWGAKWSPKTAAAPVESEWVAPQASPTGLNVPRQFSNLSNGSRQPSARTMSSQSSPHISASQPRGSPMVSPNASPHISASQPRGTPMVSPNASPSANACVPHSAMSTPQTVASMPSHISNRTASTMASAKDAPEQPWWKNQSGWEKKKEAAHEPPTATHDPKDYKFTNGSWQKQEPAQVEPAQTYVIPLQPKAEEPKQEEQSWESHWADSKAAKSEWWTEMQREDQAAADAEQQWIDYYNGYQYGYAEGTRQAGKTAEYKSAEKRVQWQDLTVKTEFTAAAENPATQKKAGNSGWIQPPPGIKRAPVRRAVNLLCKGEREGNVKEPFQTILYEPEELGFDKRTGEKAIDLFFPDFCRRRISVA